MLLSPGCCWCDSTAICQLCTGLIPVPYPIHATMTDDGTNPDNPTDLPWCFNTAYGSLQLDNGPGGSNACYWSAVVGCVISGQNLRATVIVSVGWMPLGTTTRNVGVSLSYEYMLFPGTWLGYASWFGTFTYSSSDPNDCTPFAITVGPNWDTYVSISGYYGAVTNGPIVELTL